MTRYQLHIKTWSNCHRCDLGDQRGRIVLCRGNLPCDILFVGEAPGQSEDVLGQPFVGPAGKMLDDWIEEAGLNGSYRVAFTNLVACYPRLSKEAGTNEPETKEIKACSGRLIEMIKIANPQSIVCVGKLAEKWLPKEFSCVSIVHPAAVLKAPIAQQGLMLRRAVVTLANAAQQLIPF